MTSVTTDEALVRATGIARDELRMIHRELLVLAARLDEDERMLAASAHPSHWSGAASAAYSDAATSVASSVSARARDLRGITAMLDGAGA